MDKKKWKLGVGIWLVCWLGCGAFLANKILPTMKKEEPKPSVQIVAPSKIIEEEKKDNSNFDREKLLEEMKQSAVLNYFSLDAFGKNVADLTETDFEQVIYIDYNSGERYYNYYFEYGLLDGTRGKLSVNSEEINLNVFNLFPNLEYLDSDHINYRNKDTMLELSKLTHIGVKVEMMDPISKKMSHPELITSFRAHSSFGDVSFEGMEALEEVSINSGLGSTNLSALSKLQYLKKLQIECAHGELDISQIQSLTSLESLYIKSEKLKDIRFIQNMPNLVSFGIENTSVINLEALQSKIDQLEELYLINNYSAKNYNCVAEMTRLKKLALDGNFSDSNAFPDISNLTALEELYIGETEDVSSFHNLKNVKKLTLDHLLSGNMNFLLDMPALKELHVHNGSLYSKEIYTIAKCTQIETLCLNDTFVWDDISCVLNMPNLIQLDTYRTAYGLMLDRVTENHTLKYWNLEASRVYSLTDDGQWYFDNRIIGAKAIAGVFEKLEAIENLYIPSFEFEDLEFLSGCTKLEFLDARGNYLVDLNAVKDLPLKNIRCSKNQIYDYAGYENITEK